MHPHVTIAGANLGDLAPARVLHVHGVPAQVSNPTAEDVVAALSGTGAA